MNRKEIGEKIFELRTKKGWTQHRLALEAGISTSYLPEIERGEKCPTVEMLDNICFALGISLLDFFAKDKTEESDRDIVAELTPKQRQLLNDFLNELTKKE